MLPDCVLENGRLSRLRSSSRARHDEYVCNAPGGPPLFCLKLAGTGYSTVSTWGQLFGVNLRRLFRLLLTLRKYDLPRRSFPCCEPTVVGTVRRLLGRPVLLSRARRLLGLDLRSRMRLSRKKDLSDAHLVLF